MILNKKYIGNLGENIAIRYLLKSGYRIIKRNHKEGFDEIDIIAQNPEGILIFVEVKTLNYKYGVFSPEDNFSYQKIRRITRACMKFAAKHPHLIRDEYGWRIDLVAILLKDRKYFDLHHYKNM
jgi:putative endonuclease